MIRIMIFITLCFASKVKPQLMNTTAEDLVSSGDGEVLVHSIATLIDETGEISQDTASPSLLNVETSSNNSNLDNDDLGYQTTVMTIERSSLETTTTAPTTITTESPTTTEYTTVTTFVPTTTEETTSTLTTTVTSHPTTIRPTATTRRPVTITRHTLPRKTTKSVDHKSTTTATHAVPTVETSAPQVEGKKCSFIDESFVCDFELICYGEGEIDCSDDIDALLPAYMPVESSSSSTSISEDTDYFEYDNEESATIGLFPSDLVGRVSPKKRLPFLFKMGPLTTPLVPTDLPIETTDGANSRKAETSGGETFLEKETSAATISFTVTDSTIEPAAPSTSRVSTTGSTHENATEGRISTEGSPVTETSINQTISNDLSNSTTDIIPNNNVTTELEEISAAIIDDSSETPASKILVRRKRDKNSLLSSDSESSSSSISSSLQSAALEGPKQKIRIKTCHTTGNLKCSPTPIIGTCKGRSFCQVLPNAGETSEKSTSAKGVENWAIAVIAICAIAAALTVSLLIYLVVTSWKKLKVQPQNGVTTLTYVNNSPP